MNGNSTTDNTTSTDTKPKRAQPYLWQRGQQVDINIIFQSKFHVNHEKGIFESIRFLFILQGL